MCRFGKMGLGSWRVRLILTHSGQPAAPGRAVAVRPGGDGHRTIMVPASAAGRQGFLMPKMLALM